MKVIKMKKKIVYVTGSRAEYGVIRNLLIKMNKDSEIELSLIVTGSHLMKEFGYTIKDIENDKLRIAAKVDMKIKSTPKGNAKSTAYAIMGITDALEKISPDLLILIGDRSEMLAGAVSAMNLSIPIVHISGGDVSGHIIDDCTRHAITKMSHIHLAETRKSAGRILKMGEERKRVFFVGNPSLTFERMQRKESNRILSSFGIDSKLPFAILIYHPTPKDDAKKSIIEILSAIKEKSIQTLAVYPNADSRCDDVVLSLESFARSNPFMKLQKSIPHEKFQAVMQRACFMIGNSSSALFEAPFFRLPAINIGIRQERREKAKNVIDVKICTKEKVLSAIEKASSKQFRKEISHLKNPYYKKNSADEIIRIIKSIKADEALLEKRSTF
ncbi:MAG: UDP-N-acetylglucosamine 2-epimerase [Candidatus Woesearchaeota archaeon]|nr:UDP-N-acetylglucosamine 2-epimerase [Candidatus Woesearchaeota archaeon]